MRQTTLPENGKLLARAQHWESLRFLTQGRQAIFRCPTTIAPWQWAWQWMSQHHVRELKRISGWVVKWAMKELHLQLTPRLDCCCWDGLLLLWWWIINCQQMNFERLLSASKQPDGSWEHADDPTRDKSHIWRVIFYSDVWFVWDATKSGHTDPVQFNFQSCSVFAHHIVHKHQWSLIQTKEHSTQFECNCATCSVFQSHLSAMQRSLQGTKQLTNQGKRSSKQCNLLSMIACVADWIHWSNSIQCDECYDIFKQQSFFVETESEWCVKLIQSCSLHGKIKNMTEQCKCKVFNECQEDTNALLAGAITVFSNVVTSMALVQSLLFEDRQKWINDVMSFHQEFELMVPVASKRRKMRKEGPRRRSLSKIGCILSWESSYYNWNAQLQQSGSHGGTQVVTDLNLLIDQCLAPRTRPGLHFCEFNTRVSKAVKVVVLFVVTFDLKKDSLMFWWERKHIACDQRNEMTAQQRSLHFHDPNIRKASCKWDEL